MVESINYNVLILGSDANAYYMGRCYYEAYHKKAYMLVNKYLPYTTYSNIINIVHNDKIWEEEEFLKAIYEFKREHNNYLTLLISTNESYAKLISKNSKRLRRDNFTFNYPSIDIMESLIMKEKFYKTYNDSIIDLPKTYYLDCSKEIVFNEDMMYPLILKPSNVIMYNHLSFEGKKKIYQIKSKEELLDTASRIKDNGYTDYLIVQDFIPGDDSYLFDAVAYVNSNYEVELLTLAQIGLQEHSGTMVGNAAVLINGYNQYTTSMEIAEKMKRFLEDIGYQGFCEFDLKYDYRDNTFKVLEINARQGRCSYYLSSLGYNLVEVLIEDLIYHKRNDFKFLQDKVLLSFVPKRIVNKYITNIEYKEEVKRLWKGRVNPLYYKEDRNIKRKLWLLKRRYRYYKEYRNGYWDSKIKE